MMAVHSQQGLCHVTSRTIFHSQKSGEIEFLIVKQYMGCFRARVACRIIQKIHVFKAALAISPIFQER